MRALLLVVLSSSATAQTWVLQSSGTTSSLRGVSAVNAKVVWASGANGTYLKTLDSGVTWSAGVVHGAEKLDFRAVHGVDDQTAYLLSIGPGDQSRIYKTTDGGSEWSLKFTNPDAKGFFDGLAFWDRTLGIAIGDAVDGHMAVFTTGDSGEHWQKRETPPALAGEGAFAASNSSLFVWGAQEAWFATGGTGAARVFHSTDRGRTWTVSNTPVRNDGPAAGIFSLAFSDALHGIAVGGDYNKPAETSHNIAVTRDGGRTWTEPAGDHPHGFRSAVAFLADRRMWIATGPSGSDVSTDGGNNWTAFDSGPFNALSFLASGAGWAVGPQGRVAVFKPARRAP